MSKKRELSPGPSEMAGTITSKQKVQGDEIAEENAPVEVSNAEDILLSNWLLQMIYKGRASTLQKRLIGYIVNMRHAPNTSVDEYITFIRTIDPSVEGSVVAKEWERVKRFFNEVNQEEYSIIAELANVPALMAAFRAAPTLDAQMVEAAYMPPPPLPSAVNPGSSSSPSARSRSRSNSNSDNSGSGSGSAKTLSPSQVALMQALFKVNFEQFQGDEWILPSGAIFDRVLYDTVKDARYECPLHSFVLEKPTAVLALFADARDQAELKKVLIDRTEEKLPELSAAEKGLLNVYNRTPEELEDLFAEKGWRAVGASLLEKPSADFQRLVYEHMQQLLKVYREGRMVLPQAPHESWVVNRLWSFLADALNHPHCIEFQPGEYFSQASMYRRNSNRPRDVRQIAGHKVDGVVIEASRKLELLAIEAAKKDEGPNVTKALNDGMKLCKLTKDMHDLIRCKARRNVREKFATFAIQISGQTAIFYSLRQRRGRMYQFCCEGSVSLPSVWVNAVHTQGVLGVLKKVLVVRKALLATAQEVASITTGSLDESEAVESEADWVTATMTSPQLIPSSPLTANQEPKLRL
ncbi:hypothetical protein BGZ72_002042 [Mortierella alpina]|nr:hypothetical protein BGZ72_002042 [Mortierella alpina]